MYLDSHLISFWSIGYSWHFPHYFFLASILLVDFLWASWTYDYWDFTSFCKTIKLNTLVITNMWVLFSVKNLKICSSELGSNFFDQKLESKFSTSFLSVGVTLPLYSIIFTKHRTNCTVEHVYSKESDNVILSIFWVLSMKWIQGVLTIWKKSSEGIKQTMIVSRTQWTHSWLPAMKRKEAEVWNL